MYDELLRSLKQQADVVDADGNPDERATARLILHRATLALETVVESVDSRTVSV